jgi:hypothetical protein
MPVKLITDTQVREMFGGISAMTLHRWRRVAPPKIPFPQPIHIHGRNYNDEDGISDYVQAIVNAESPANIIPNSEEGRAKGLEKIAAINAAKNDPLTSTDQLGHNNAPPLDDGVEPSVQNAGEGRTIGRENISQKDVA